MAASVFPSAETQAELQDDIMRFEGRFWDRLVHALAPLERSRDPAIRRGALERELAYSSSVLDIAVGGNPVANLVDMVTFIDLSRDRVESHWVPRVFHEAGAPLAEAFRESADDIGAIAEKYTTPAQRGQLERVIGDWREANAGQVQVEAVRLTAFSKLTGTKAEQARREATGLLGDMKKGLRAAEAAALLGDRMLYLVQRLPFLLELHARVGGNHLFADTKQNLVDARGDAEALRRRAEQTADRLMTRGFLLLCGAMLFGGAVYVGVRLLLR